MKIPFRRSTVFFLFFSLFSLTSVIFFFSVFPLSSEYLVTPAFSDASVSTFLLRPLVFYSVVDLFLLELFILLLLCCLMVSGGIMRRSFLYLLSSIFILIYFIQMASLYVGREFLSRLAIENADHLYLFLDFRYLVFFLIIAGTCILMIFLTETATQSHRKQFLPIVIPLLVACILCTLLGSYWLPASVLKARDNFLTKNNLDHTSPVLSLYETIFHQKMSHNESPGPRKLKRQELEEISKLGFVYDPNAEFPLIKTSIYNSPPPFPMTQGKEMERPNVIIFFTEGLSARAIKAYNSKYPDLTPHIDEFASTSMVVKRYYNHTAATYRGLHGQLASLYPFYGGIDGWHSDNPDVSGRSYLSLADLFNNAGYETIFLDSHHEMHPSKVDLMMTELGFSTVITGDQLVGTYLDGEDPKGDMAYSDHQYLKAVTAFLKQRADQGGQPFLLSLYNFGTHAFLGNSKDGVRYGKGGNSALNNIHNLDNAFGLLWNFLKDSPLGETTILVVTADHSHFHERAFVNAFKESGYQQLFIDRIPLIIHDPLRRLPREYDAENSSSIDFAPTIAHFLGLQNGPNPFMGNSIFESHKKPYRQLSVAALGPHEIFLIDNDRIHTLADSQKHTFTLKAAEAYIEKIRQLELEDRIWPDYDNGTP